MEGLETTPTGLIRAQEDMSTNLPGVFAGGDVRWRFGRNATDAIADGQKAARAIHSSRCLLCGTCVDTCVYGALKLVRLADIQGDEKVARLTGALEKRSSRSR